MLRIDRDLVLAIEPECYRRWIAEIGVHASDGALLEKAHAPEAAARLAPTKRAVGNIAVINISGFITQKPSLFTMLFGGMSTEELVATVRAAMAEPSVGAVVLNVDSPGGAVSGVPEAAAALRGMRGMKPFVAVANPFMASAAYWLACQADEVVGSPSSIAGSIGAMVTYVDESKAIAQAGLSVEEITHGRRKAEATGTKPLTDEARAAIQARVDYFGTLFETDVAKGRRVSVATVRARYGEGAVFTTKDALAAGLLDRVASLDEVLGGLASGQKPAGARAAAPEPGPSDAVDSDPVEIAALATLAGLPRERE